jgi:hypothetical protein
MKISGKLAQFGSGMIQEVSEKLIGTFVQCLEGKITAPPVTAPATAAPGPASSPVTPVTAVPAPAAAHAAPPVPPTMPTSAPPVVPDDAADPAVAASAAEPVPPTMPSAAPPLTVPEPSAQPSPQPSGQPSPEPSAQPSPTSGPAPQQQEVEALDLGKYAGSAIAKRAVPVLVALGVVVVAVVVWVATR